MNEKTTIKNTRIGIYAKGVANVGKNPDFWATAPGVSPVVERKKGKSFTRKRTKGLKKPSIVTVASRERDFHENVSFKKDDVPVRKIFWDRVEEAQGALASRGGFFFGRRGKRG